MGEAGPFPEPGDRPGVLDAKWHQHTHVAKEAEETGTWVRAWHPPLHWAQAPSHPTSSLSDPTPRV